MAKSSSIEAATQGSHLVGEPEVGKSWCLGPSALSHQPSPSRAPIPLDTCPRRVHVRAPACTVARTMRLRDEKALSTGGFNESSLTTRGFRENHLDRVAADGKKPAGAGFAAYITRDRIISLIAHS